MNIHWSLGYIDIDLRKFVRAVDAIIFIEVIASSPPLSVTWGTKEKQTKAIRSPLISTDSYKFNHLSLLLLKEDDPRS